MWIFILERITSDINLRFCYNTKAKFNGCIDVCEGIVDDVQGFVFDGRGGVCGFAVGVDVGEGGEGGCYFWEIEEETCAHGGYAIKEGDTSEELGLEAAGCGKGNSGGLGLEGDGGYACFVAVRLD